VCKVYVCGMYSPRDTKVHLVSVQVCIVLQGGLGRVKGRLGMRAKYMYVE
jgi:hypothetical protein